MLEKLFKGVLVLNWKNGQIRVTKKKPKTGPWEIPITLNIKVKLPAQKEIVAKGEVEIPDYKVDQMIIEAI